MKEIYFKLFPSLREHLKKELLECEKVLDLGCGKNSPIQYCDVKYSVGADMFYPYIKESRKKRIHNKYIIANIRKINFKYKFFDAVLLLDVLEHLPKKDGIKLLQKVEYFCKKKIIVYTPNGFLKQEEYDGNPFQKHVSGWYVEDFKKLGFKVYGINGFKFFRTYRAELKYKPKIFWQVLCDLSQKIAWRYPKIAFQLFAVKYL